MTNHEIDLDKISEEQKKLYSALIAWRPDFKKYCKIESQNNQHKLHVELLSPTGDSDRNIVIWVEDENDISIGFGPWHTHGYATFETDKQGYYEDVSIIDLVKMIVSNKIVIYDEIGGDKAFSSILNLKYPNAIASELTDKYSTGEIDIRSWDGTQDRRISLKDLSIQ